MATSCPERMGGGAALELTACRAAQPTVMRSQRKDTRVFGSGSKLNLSGRLLIVFILSHIFSSWFSCHFSTFSSQKEAHKMVREANVKQANAEKQLKEALGKIDVLQAEVQALKTLVLSSPTSPVGELPSAKTRFRKGHSRNKSTSSAILGTQPDPSATQPIVRECREVDSQLFSEFKAWKEEPTLDRGCCFLERVYREDIYPCLTFSKSELGSAILEAVEQNTLSVEPVGFQPLPVVKASAVECGGPKKCALSGQTKTCKHRIKFGDSSNYYYVSPYCRYRITAVCNFFTYIRYIHQGLVKQQDAEQMFWEVMQLRREMSFAKLGYYKDQL
ncbi:rab-3A-interacting protein isoform X3 [Lates japonicus]|uniref:Rab-3A-interacting protein isoform X3 n=1 Tax=Lates japonicus TaxID=270547 RepID=A0AAD3NFY8_LATJO|nr:rab-3A-interacting protein isoform X3 [Lates japonicus]